MGLAFMCGLPWRRRVGSARATSEAPEAPRAQVSRGGSGGRRARHRDQPAQPQQEPLDDRRDAPRPPPTAATAASLAPPLAPSGGAVAPAVVGGRRRSIPPGVLACVVKLIVTHCAASYEMPWVMEKQYGSTSSGFVVRGRRILTCAHCVEDATVVLIKLYGSDEKYTATVAAVAYECDTAVLTVDDDLFWEEVELSAKEANAEPFIKLGPLPDLQAECVVIGFPFPGENICVTQGVCSRVEVETYPDKFMPRMLAVQLDAAVNPGNSGGPVFNERFECVGIAFGVIADADIENCAYFVPTLIVEHFLKDLEIHDGVYTGFPELGLRFQKLENKQMRRALGLKNEAKGNGVLIREVSVTSDASRILKRGDILTSIDDVPISHSGTVPFDELPGDRIEMQYVANSHFVGDEIELTFFRDGAKHSGKMRLSAYGTSKLVQSRVPRQYIIYGGLVFVVLSVQYLQEKYDSEIDNAPLSMLNALYEGLKKDDGITEIVVLGHVLATQVSIGFEAHNNLILRKVDGVIVKNLVHLAQILDALDSNPSRYVEFELEDNELIILNKRVARESLSSTLETYSVPRARLLPMNDNR